MLIWLGFLMVENQRIQTLLQVDLVLAIKDVELCCSPTVEAVGKEILLLKCCLQDLGIKQIDEFKLLHWFHFLCKGRIQQFSPSSYI